MSSSNNRMEHLASRKFSKIIALDHANNFKTFFNADLMNFENCNIKFLGGWEGKPDFLNQTQDFLNGNLILSIKCD